ncbi:MAG: hypothetical protein P8186_12180 [Anaerolineae bacterium]|jgi:hypothetical protein
MPTEVYRKWKRWRKQITKWLGRIGFYRVFGISVWGWLVILLMLAGIGGSVFLTIRESSNLSESETFVAEVRDIWIEEYQNESGGYRIHRIRLKQDEDEFACRVSPVAVQLWYQLEIGKSYEFSAARTRSQCYIYKATEIDKLQSFGIRK